MKDQNKDRIPKDRLDIPEMFRPRDLEALGIPRSRLRAMLRHGEVQRVARGLYRRVEVPATEHETIAMVCKKIPKAIICLLTALRIYGIGTQNPREVWIALDRKARKPRIKGLPVRIVRFSGPMLHYAIMTQEIQGVHTQITSPARTVVDCFRYRKKVGLDVALEALREVLRSRTTTVDDIMRSAEVCRVSSVIRPYLESFAS
jgi:predicted transcriptional regulator of viral defense system